MYRKANLLFLLNETPLHAGSGDSLGIVDLPIQRERHTGFPKIEASSLKGSIREHFERNSENGINAPKIIAAFGSDGGSNESSTSKAGALGFTDARLLLFPVKSMRGVFAWITCPRILNKFSDELKLVGIKKEFQLVSYPKQGSGVAAAGNKLSLNEKFIVLEEYTFEVNERLGAKNFVNDFGEYLSRLLYDDKGYFADKLMTDIVVLTDDDFKDFVNLSTEVITRTQIDNQTGTVKDGALFTEEYLPAESLMYSLALFAPEFADKERESEKQFKTHDDLQKYFRGLVDAYPVMQIGGNATLGKGITRVKIVEPDKNGGNQ